MMITRSRLGRRLSAVVAGTLAAGALVALAPAASAEQTGSPVAGSGVATWGLSDYLNSSNPGRPNPSAANYVAPATFTPAVVEPATPALSSWGAGEGTVAADGSAELDFDGTTVNWATTGNAWLKLKDPHVSIDATGTGTVSAEVTYGTTTAGDWATATTIAGPTRVTVVDLSVSPQTGDAVYPAAISGVPFAFSSDDDSYDWTGLKGRWSTAFQTFLAGNFGTVPATNGCQTTSTCWAYASTVVNNVVSGVSRYPSVLKLTIARAEAATTATASLDQDGIAIDVSGEGFAKTFPGVYVSLRELPASPTPYGGGSVTPDLATAWVSNLESDIGSGDQGAAAAVGADGSFETQLRIAPEDVDLLDPAKSYTVVTRKAHGMGANPSHASQITETPVDLADEITAAQARKFTTTSATAAPVAVGNDSTVSVTVASLGGGTPAGAVKVMRNGVQVGVSDLNGAGTAQIPVSGLPVGTTDLDVLFEGHSDFWKSAGTVAATVTKVTSGVGVTGAGTVAYRTGSTYQVVVNGSAPTGTVTVTGAGTAKVLTLAGGKASYVLPSTLTAGAKTLTFAYSGDATNAASSATKKVTVAKGATVTTRAIVVKATRTKAGKVRFTVASVKGGPVPTGKVALVITKGKTKKVVTGKVLAGGRVVITLPKVGAGTWTVRATYGGSANHLSSVRVYTFKVS